MTAAPVASAGVINACPHRSREDGPVGWYLDLGMGGTPVATVTCPNGLTARITRTRTAVFGARCRDCPLRARCTTSAAGRTRRLHPHDALQRAHRARARDPEFQAVYRQHRSMVERSISWLDAARTRPHTVR